jgi:DUF1680 family protein
MTTTRRTFLELSGLAAVGVVAPHIAEGVDTGSGPTSTLDDRLMKARPLPLDRVRLTGGPLQHAQQLTARYLLSLNPDSMMAYYRIRAGLPQKAEPYGGWDGPKKNLTGHIAGHHLSAVSLMYRALGDERFKQRADYLVGEMGVVQAKHGDGYLSALENGREAFAQVSQGDIRAAAFDLNGLWSPWYVLHKTFAGLRDAYRYTGNRTARDVSVRFAGWAERVLAPLNDAQVQHMLNTEHGGMNEVLGDLYAESGVKRWLDLSYRFEHHAFTDALKRHEDNLSGKHGNCQIPKLVGSAARYGYVGDTADIIAASFFWDRVVQHHTYAAGGHGLAEYFGPPDVLSTRIDGRTCESCNVYNMLKLTRRLFAYRPDGLYADFHERAIFNHILASIDPEDGRVSYMVPIGRAVEQEYQDPYEDFTCCCGTGMESHALHGYGIYYESADTVWVNLFAPSTAVFTTANVTLRMATGFPDGDDATITVSLPKPKLFTLAVRRPVWAGDGYAVQVNGTTVPQPSLASLRPGGAGGRGGAPGNEGEAQHGSYAKITRLWKDGDTVQVSLPKSVHLEPTPDNRNVAAIMWGPLVLAGNLGPRREGRSAPAIVAPTLEPGKRSVDEWVLPAGRPGDFTLSGVTRAPGATGLGDLAVAPFYRTQRRTYSVYFDIAGDVVPGGVKGS